MLTIIAAAGEHNELGKNNDLVWHLPDDFKRFKKLTSGHHIIMGRKTFESFEKPLPNRTHVVITRQQDFGDDEIVVAHSLPEAISTAKKHDNDPYIIGGGQVYAMSLEYVDRIELTRVHGTFEADTYFPEIDERKWKLVSQVFHDKDEKHKYAFTYLTYERQ